MFLEALIFSTLKRWPLLSLQTITKSKVT